MPGEKILVTGGLGAIGSFVTRHFIENGYSPIVFDSRPDFSLVSDLKEQFELVLGDIMDFPALSRIVKENKIRGITNLTPSYNKLIISFDLSITNFNFDLPSDDL